MPRLRLLLFLLFVSFTAMLSAQSRFVVSGTMVDSLGKDKIFYAQVALLESDSATEPVTYTYTDGEGKFTLDPVPAGDYVLYCSLVGYNTFKKQIAVGGDSRKVDVGKLAMSRASLTLEGISVTAQKPIFAMEGEKMLYNVSEDPTIHAGTATDALQNAPGVEVDIEGNVTIRGGGSVEIWLNDRPSNMNADALKDFLQQMPADNIERIEVTTNPSARYSASGASSIINIVTVSKIKKNSFISFGLRGSSTPDVSPWLSYVWASKKFTFNIYANYSYNYFRMDDEINSVLYNDNGDTSSTFATETHQLNKSHRGGIFLNGTYMPDSTNTISFWGGTWPSMSKSFAFESVQHTEYIHNPGVYDYDDYTDGAYRHPQFSVGGYVGVNYTHSFNDNGHEISVDLSYNGGKSGSNGLEIKNYADPNLIDMNRERIYKGDYHYVDAGVDYTLPYHENGEIELGVSGGYHHGNTYSRRDSLVWAEENFYQTDSMRLENCVNAGGNFSAYVTLQHKFGGFTLKGGLRTQYEAFDYNYLDFPQYNFAKGYWGLYPSLHLSYSTKTMHNFKLSYTRRVSYPNGGELTPFITYGDDSYSTGNPELLPAYTNSVEAGWSKFIDKFGNVGVNAYFRNTKDETHNLSDVIFDPFFGRIVTFSKPMNAGKSLSTGLNLNVTYRLKAFMSLRFYTNLTYQKQEFMFRNEADMRKVENFSYSFRLNFWAKLWKFLEVNLSGNYNSKSVYMFSISKPRYSIDCGSRAEFWKHHISVFVDVDDIFNWNKQRSQSVNPYYTSTSVSSNSWSSRSIRAGITFRFGKMELESRARQGGAEQGM